MERGCPANLLVWYGCTARVFGANSVRLETGGDLVIAWLCLSAFCPTDVRELRFRKRFDRDVVATYSAVCAVVVVWLTLVI